jgi:hypothetical protein
MTYVEHNIENSSNKIIHKDRNPFKIEEVEKIYKVKYVGEFSVKNTSGDFVNLPVSIFFGEKHPDGSNYMAMYVCPLRDSVYIADGLSAVEDAEGNPVVFSGVLLEDTDEILYSAYRHDYQSKDGVMVDGGRDYFRAYLKCPIKKFFIKDGMFFLVDSN